MAFGFNTLFSNCYYFMLNQHLSGYFKVREYFVHAIHSFATKYYETTVHFTEITKSDKFGIIGNIQ